jgi:hypothetical protein
MSLVEGESYQMAPDKAQELAALGYVEPAKEGAAKALTPTRPGDEPSMGTQRVPGEGDLPTAPKVPRR